MLNTINIIEKELSTQLNPYPVFFGTITESDLWKKKSKIISGDVTVGTWAMKIICADRVSGYIMTLNSNGICQYRRKYAALLYGIIICRAE